MRVALVHHAEAESPAADALRPLTALGHRQAEALATQLGDEGFSPLAIWHSGKLRARQTAEACLRRLNPSAEFRMVRGLRPEDPPDWIRHELEAEPRDIMVVGHMPNISELARSLGADQAGVPLHGAVVVTRSENGKWSEVLRLTPD